VRSGTWCSGFDEGEVLALTVALALLAGFALWYLFGTCCCVASRVWPHCRALWRLQHFAPRRVRRVAGLACGATFVWSPVAAHAVVPTEAPAPPEAEAPFVRTPAPSTLAPGPTTTAPGPVAPPVTAPTTTPPTPPTPAVTGSRTHVVVPGDNLWRLAASEVARVSGVARPPDRAIVPYWRAVIDANRASLRSGDPSLVFPGEVVVLPAP
jgi:nucleoid-associated protein YgaU